MQYDDFRELCEHRRTIRYFGQKPVAKDEVMKLLELARHAPSVENLQPWHFHVIFNQKLRKELMETCCYGNFVEGASVFLLVSADRSLQSGARETVWNPKELEYSCMVAIEHILLGATALGLGSSLVSLHHGAAHELLKLPMNEIVVAGIMLGHYKKGEEEPGGGHNRHPLEKIYTLYE